MIVYPLVVAVVAAAFGFSVLGQWVNRRRSQQLVWGIALLMAAVASAAFVGFLADGSELLFRIYYAFGGLMMAAFLGMGSLYLAIDKRIADLVLAALVVLSAIGVALILVAPVDAQLLHRLAQTSGEGTNVLKPGPWVAPVILLNTFGAASVVLVALFSAYRVVRRQAPTRFAVANVAIAIGALLITAGGSSGRFGLNSPNFFWVFMAVGWVVIFAGFLLTTNLAAVGTLGSRNLAATTA
jgi:hypothetical protein